MPLVDEWRWWNRLRLAASLRMAHSCLMSVKRSPKPPILTENSAFLRRIRCDIILPLKKQCFVGEVGPDLGRASLWAQVLIIGRRYEIDFLRPIFIDHYCCSTAL